MLLIYKNNLYIHTHIIICILILFYAILYKYFLVVPLNHKFSFIIFLQKK